MASNASRGARAKARTKKWLEAQGYQVADMEIVRWIFTARGRMPVKRDQWGSDLAAMNAEHLVLIQCKSGASASGGTFPEARRIFQSFTFPPGVQCWVMAWGPRARVPRILVVNGEDYFERSA